MSLHLILTLLYVDVRLTLPICILTGTVHNHSFTSFILRVCDDHPYILLHWWNLRQTVKELFNLYMYGIVGR